MKTKRMVPCFLRLLFAAGAGVFFLFTAGIAQAQRPLPLTPPVQTNEVSSLIVVYKPSAFAKDGKSLSSKASSFKSVKAPEKLYKGKLKGLKSKSGEVKLSKAAQNLENMHVAKIAEGSSLKEAIQELKSSPDVLYVEPNYPVKALGMPNDPYFSEVWGLNNTGQTYHDGLGNPVSGVAGCDINWTNVYGEAIFPTNEVLVAVIDTGVYYDHYDLTNRMWRNPGESGGGKESNGIDDDGNGWVDDVYGMDAVNMDGDPYDDNGHGTHCSGTIAAQGENNRGIIGVYPKAKIMGCKFLAASGSGSGSDALKCIIYAADMGAKVMNNSWGGGGFSQATQDAITYAREKGAIFLAAAGNDGQELTQYPAAYEGAVAIAASDSDDSKVGFSNWGTWVDLMAPGHRILSLRAPGAFSTKWGPPDDSTNKMCVLSGTSMATPCAAGAAAALYAQHPGLDPDIYEKVMKAASDTNIYSLATNAAYIGKIGTGRVDLNAMLRYSATSAWVSASIGGSTLAIGDQTNVLVSIYTWAQPVTNLSVKLVNVESNLQVIGASTAWVGTASALAATNLPSGTFTVKMRTNAAENTQAWLDVALCQSASTMDVQRVNIATPSTMLSLFTVADMDTNGYREVIGLELYGMTLYSYDHTGKKNWSVALPAGASVQYSENLIQGDFDGDGMTEILVQTDYQNTEPLRFYVVEANGTVSKIYTNGIGQDWMVGLLAAKLNGDSADDLLISVGTQLRALDIKNSAVLWTMDPAQDYTFAKPAIGDVDADGDLDIVALESSTVTEIGWQVHIINTAGTITRSIPVTAPVSRPLLGDINKDGLLEIVCGTHIFNPINGESMNGWPKDRVSGTIMALADMDHDGYLEMLALDRNAYALNVFRKDGSMLPGFPVLDLEFEYFGTAGSEPFSVSDVDSDGYPDIVYLSKLREVWDKTKYGDDWWTDPNCRQFYDLRGMNHQGLKLHDFPKTFEQSALYSENGYGRLAVDWLAPGFESGSGNAVIMCAQIGPLFQTDAGAPFDANAHEWPSTFHDWQYTDCYPGTNQGVYFYASNTYGYLSSASIRFYASRQNIATNGLVWQWDFNNDGTVDQSGSNLSSPTNTFGSSSNYTVRVTLTNVLGQSVTMVLTNYVTVYPATEPVADFVCFPTNGQKDLNVNFDERSLYADRDCVWRWDVDNNGSVDSTNRDANYTYTSTGLKSVRMIVSNTLYHVWSAKTNLNYINVSGTYSGPTTNHYVSLNGTHSYPYRTLAEAATNIQAALEACSPGHQVLVDKGVYTSPGEAGTLAWVVNNNSTIRGLYDPEDCVLDGNHENQVLVIYASDVRVENLTIANGLAMQGAGINVYEGGNQGIVIKNCILRGNRSPETGFLFDATAGSALFAGALVTWGDAVTTLVTVVDTVIESNESPMSVVCAPRFTTITMSNCTVRGNRAGSSVLKGSDFNGDVIIMRNCVVANNRAGVYPVAVAEMDNCTLYGNVSWLVAHGSYAYTMRNNILWGGSDNWDAFWLGDPRFADGQPDLVFFNCTTPALPYAGYTRTNDPQFVNTARGDFRLPATSPCVDGGTNWRNYYYATAQVVRIDFGSSTGTTPGNWNNVTNINFIGRALTNAIATNGAFSGIQFSFISNAIGWRADGLASPAVSNWPNSAAWDFLYWPKGKTNWIRLEGLDQANYYNIKLYANTTNQEEIVNYGTYYNIGGYSVSMKQSMSVNNTNAPPVEFTNVRPDTNGYIRISLNSDYDHPAVEYALLGVMEIVKLERVYTDCPITNWTDIALTNRVLNGTVDMGAYEYTGNLTPWPLLEWVAPEWRKGQPVSFTATNSYDADGSITNYTWNFGDGSISNGAALSTVAHVFTNTGAATVTLTLRDNTGAVATERLTLDILPPVPNDPINLTGTNNAPLQMQLNWGDASSDEDGFRVERTIYTYPPIDYIVDSSQLTYFPTGRVTVTAPGVPPYWEWRATNDAGCVGGSYLYAHFKRGYQYFPAMEAICFPHVPVDGWYEVSIRYPDNNPWPITDTPSPLFSYATNWPMNMDVLVTHADGTEHSFIDETVNTYQWVKVGTYRLDAASNIKIGSGTAVDAFRFVKLEDFQIIGHNAANNTNFTDTAASGVTDGKTYVYRVVATNEFGDSSPSDEEIVSIDFTNQHPTAAITWICAPSGTITWAFSARGTGSDPDGTITNYQWNFGDGYAGSIQSGANLTNVSYNYRYVGSNTITFTVWDNLGRQSLPVSTNVRVAGPIPSAPANLAAFPASDTSIRLTWSDLSIGENGFEVQRQTNGGAFAKIGSVSYGVTSYLDSACATYVSYTYRVRATNQYGASGWSATATTNTADSIPPTLQDASATASNRVRLTFSEAMDPITLETAGNYAINNGITVLAAIRDADPAKVKLVTTALSTGITYTVTVNNVKDAAGLVIATNSTQNFVWSGGAANRTVYFDCGPAANPTTGNWNNVTAATAGIKVTNAVDSAGGNTGMRFNITDAFAGTYSGNIADATRYPTNAKRDCIYLDSTDTNGVIQLENLTAGLSYDVIFYGYRSSSASDRRTLYTVGANSVILDAYNNLTNVAVIAGLSPDASSNITIRINPYLPAGVGYLNVLEVNYGGGASEAEAYAVEADVSSIAVPENGSANFNIRLTGEPSSAVTVAVARASGDTNITVSGGSSLVFYPTNFYVWQTVTLSASPDDDTQNGTSVIRCALLSSTTDVIATETDSGAVAQTYLLTAAANNPQWGQVSPTGGVYAAGSNVQIAATASNYYHFVQWVCDPIDPTDPSEPVDTILMTTNRTVQAVFSEDLLTNSTPAWWLAQYGLGTNDAAALSDTDGDSLKNWEEWIAGTVPTQFVSRLVISNLAFQISDRVITWPAVPGRLYSVYWSSNLLNGFGSNLAVDINGGGFTDKQHSAEQSGFYRIRVRMQ